MKKINHWFLIFLICLITNGLEVSAQVPCKSENLSEYLETIRTEKEVFRLKSAANCIAKLAPSKESAQVLINRLEQTFQETKSLRQDDSAFDQGRVVVDLAEALDIMKNKEGYKKIEEYFTIINWNIPRDLWFFDSIAAHASHKSELTETFYLALTRMPARTPLSRACSMFHRMNDTGIIRDEPRFIHGILSALSRIDYEEKELMKKYEKHEDLKKEVKSRSLYIKKGCEETLLSQLLDEKMRQAFLISFLGKLSADEKRILDRFFVKIAPPHVEEAVEQITRAFFDVPWKAELSDWQKKNREIICESFHGEGYVTDADDLWCSFCSSKQGLLEKRFYFYPDAEGKTCTLQKVRFSYPTTAKETLNAFGKRLVERIGPGTPKSEVHDFGSGFWEEISFWSWQQREIYVFRNKDKAWTGEGLPIVEILSRDQELTSAIRQEETAEEAIDKAKKQREKAKKEHLYHDVAKNLPDLIKRLKKTENPESKYTLLLELLSKMAKDGPDRAAQLYLADMLTQELSWPASAGEIKDWKTKQQILSTYGVVYEWVYGEFEANRVFLRKIIQEVLPGHWADEAFLYLFRTIINGEEDCKDIDFFKRVIERGGNFLKKNPKSPIRSQVILTLAEAHETGWSLSLASNKDAFVGVDGFDPKTYEAKAPYHREKAMLYYEQFLKEVPESSESSSVQMKLKRIRLGLDTNSRDYVCLFH